MVTSMPQRRDRYLYLGGPVETARAKARLLALVATLLYACCLFGAVMLAHRFADSSASEVASSTAQERAHRF